MDVNVGTWMAGLTVAERGLVLVASFSLFFGAPLLALAVFGRRGRGSRTEAYWLYLGILLAILVVGIVLSLTFQVLSGLVAWIVGNLGFVATGGVAVLFLVALAGRSSSDNYGRARVRNRWSLLAVISGVVLAVMVLGTLSGFSMPSVVGIAVPLITAILVLFVVLAVVQALSSGRDRPRRRWLAGAVLAAAIVGILLPAVINQLVPDRSSIADASRTYAQFYLVASLVCVFLLPPQIGRALYKVEYGEDVTLTHTRKPRTQRQYATAGFRCGKCRGALPGPVAQCPHCGVRFGGQQNEYLPGTPPPKSTTTTTRNATPKAGVTLLVLFAFDMLCGVALFEINDVPPHSDGVAVYAGLALVANAVVVVAAVLLVKRYARLNGQVERTSYY
jgi:hypothetical protein